ncbi:MAG: DNA-directed RNA polymerase subunit beta, partial [Oscillospiraceae bacterium]|nr:DNA-directed RNA polymerase subunit beta [Oscillospiraceae bacterium]
MVNVKPVQLGKTTRMSFARINEVLDMPNLIEVQINSYKWFLEEGLREVFSDIAAITDYTGNLVLDFIDYRLEPTPKYSIVECKNRDVTYAAKMHVRARLLNRETGEVKEQEIYMGDFPLMTESGTFVINGAERVIVSQLVRSPGVYYSDAYDKTGKKLFKSTVIPNRGAWLEYETDSADVFYVRIDKNRKIPVTVFIRALMRIRDDVTYEQVQEDFRCALTDMTGSTQEVLDLFGDQESIVTTMNSKDPIENRAPREGEVRETGLCPGDEALLEVYRKLRPGELPSLESAVKHLVPLLFDEHRYDLSRVGRYKYNKKLGLAVRIMGHVLSRPAVSELTGEIIADAGERLSREKAWEIEKAGISAVYVQVEDEKEIKVISNGMVEITDFIDVDKKTLGITEKVRFCILKEILEQTEDHDERVELISKNIGRLVPKHIIKDDILATINYMNCLAHGLGSVDDIDHLGNRRIRPVGELLQNQFRIGFSRMERVVR